MGWHHHAKLTGDLPRTCTLATSDYFHWPGPAGELPVNIDS